MCATLSNSNLLTKSPPTDAPLLFDAKNGCIQAVKDHSWNCTWKEMCSKMMNNIIWTYINSKSQACKLSGKVDLLRLWLKVLVRTKFSWFENVTLQQTIADCSKDTRNVSSEIYHFIRRHIKHHKKIHGTNPGRQMLGDNRPVAPLVVGHYKQIPFYVFSALCEGVVGCQSAQESRDRKAQRIQRSRFPASRGTKVPGLQGSAVPALQVLL